MFKQQKSREVSLDNMNSGWKIEAMRCFITQSYLEDNNCLQRFYSSFRLLNGFNYSCGEEKERIGLLDSVWSVDGYLKEQKRQVYNTKPGEEEEETYRFSPDLLVLCAK